MRQITATELLDLWELVANNALSLSPLDQSAAILLQAFPEINREALDELAIGQRERRLLQLRRWLFGPRLDGLANCPNCDQVVEFSIEIPLDEPAILASGESKEPLHQVSTKSYKLAIRHLTAADVRAAAVGETPLWRRALVKASIDGKSVDVGEVPESVEESVAAALQEADPLADILLDLSCPACDWKWQESFDPTSYFIAELDQWAGDMLFTVSRLAEAYHWREADILEMSAWRRAYYLELAGR